MDYFTIAAVFAAFILSPIVIAAYIAAVVIVWVCEKTLTLLRMLAKLCSNITRSQDDPTH